MCELLSNLKTNIPSTTCCFKNIIILWNSVEWFPKWFFVSQSPGPNGFILIFNDKIFVPYTYVCIIRVILALDPLWILRRAYVFVHFLHVGIYVDKSFCWKCIIHVTSKKYSCELMNSSYCSIQITDSFRQWFRCWP